MVREGVLIAALIVMSTGAEGLRALDRAQAIFADGTVVTLEIADTEPKRNRGLMFCEALAEREGMVFVFQRPGYYPFWMQNCRIALDILWLDAGFTVVSMAESVPPCRLPGCEPPCASTACPSYAPAQGTSASYVVEVAAGFSRRHGVKVGQKVAVQLPAR